MNKKPFILGLSSRVEAPSLGTTEQLYKETGNTGNLAFSFAISSHLNHPETTVPWGASPESISAAGGIGVIPAANQLGSHANMGKFAELLSRASAKIVIIGLGSQSNVGGKIPEISTGTLQWVKEIAHHAPSDSPNISLRGPFTKKVLDHYGFGEHAVVLGCPSLFINPDPELGRSIASRKRPIRRIAVASGHQGWKHLSKIESSLTAMVTATGGSYVGQHAVEMVQLTRGEASSMEETALRACRDFACPQMSLDEFILWSERHGNVFWDVPSWMEHYRRFDFVIGARIHGVMLALQAGVPALCLVHDSRTLELCQTMMVPYVLAKDVSTGIARDDLLALFDFDAEAFDANRRKLAADYVDFLEKNCLIPASFLKDLTKG